MAFAAPLRAKLEGTSKGTRVLLAGTLGTMLLLGAYFAVRGAYEPYAPLYKGLEREDAAAVVAKLREQKIPYRLADNGASIEIPDSRLNDVRLDLASSGLPRGTGVGFESFDKMRLGATDFEQRVLFRRSLEGELGRTINSMTQVQTARVHLVMPEKSVFVSKNEPASASVVLLLKAGQQLGPREVAGIVNTIASSVPSLTKDRVSIVTTDGQTLHRPRSNPNDPGAPDEDRSELQARTVESTLEDRARQLLERVVGPGHVDVRVTAEVDNARIERIEDRYDPTHSAVRSEEKTTERSNPHETASGVPGAESNIPTGNRATAGADGGTQPALGEGGQARETQTRNFELDHVFEKRIASGGTIKRLAVAVVFDGVRQDPNGPTVPRSQEELDKFAALVRGAVGIDDRRGDSVSVQSIPFLEEPKPVVPAEVPSAMPLKLPPKYARFVPVAGAAAVVLGILAAVLLRRRSNKKKAKLAQNQATSAEVASTAKALAEKQESDNLTGESDPLTADLSGDELRKAVEARAVEDPATAALVLRAWLKSVVLPAPVVSEPGRKAA
jgi:flagellar M-ring protein FliF